jgi:hypothetical protein
MRMAAQHIPKNVTLLLLVELHGPVGLATVAPAVVGSHGDLMLGDFFLRCSFVCLG